MVKDIALFLSVILNFYLLYLRSKRSDESQKMLMSRLDDMEEYVHETKDETLKAKFRERRMLFTKPLVKAKEQKTGNQSTKELLVILGMDLMGAVIALVIELPKVTNEYLVETIKDVRELNMHDIADRLEEVRKELIKMPVFSEEQASVIVERLALIGEDLSKRIAENY